MKGIKQNPKRGVAGSQGERGSSWTRQTSLSSENPPPPRRPLGGPQTRFILPQDQPAFPFIPPPPSYGSSAPQHPPLLLGKTAGLESGVTRQHQGCGPPALEEHED